ncbi:MAG: YjhG/YagF family D-xylonate dehydratase, partial [Chloroflexota bacterium]
MTNKPSTPSLEAILGSAQQVIDTKTRGHGRDGKLPLTGDMLLNEPSGNLFGLTQNVAMGWNPEEVNNEQYLIVSTHGGLRAPDGSAIALG